MKKLNLFVLAILFSFTLLSIPIAKAQEENFVNVNEVNIEDDITLEELDLTEKDVESDNTLFGRFRNRLKLINFNQEKRIKAREKIANINLWKAKKMISQGNEKEKEAAMKRMARYKRHMANIDNQLEKLPPKKKIQYKSTLEKIAKKRIGHHKVLEEISNKLPEKSKLEIMELRKKNALRIKKRFKNLNDIEKEKYLEHLKKKKNLSNIEILEELDTDAPETIKKKIKFIRENHEKVIKQKINNTKNIKKLNELEDKKQFKKRPALFQELKNRRKRLKPEETTPIKLPSDDMPIRLPFENDSGPMRLPILDEIPAPADIQ